MTMCAGLPVSDPSQQKVSSCQCLEVDNREGEMGVIVWWEQGRAVDGGGMDRRTDGQQH